MINTDMTWSQVLHHCIEKLGKVTTTARLEAEYLLMHCLACTRSQLITRADQVFPQDQHNKLHCLVQRRLCGEPLAYLLGCHEFWSLEFTVTPAVLIPRPETEQLVAYILGRPLNTSGEAPLIADLGTGCGAIALALAEERAYWTIHATDQSPEALAVAQENAKCHGCDGQRLLFFQGSWCRALPRADYHLIVSNPPYLAVDDPHLPHLRSEPDQALVAGPTGLEALHDIIEQAPHYLRPDGQLILEHGYNQGAAVRHLLMVQGYRCVQDHRDMSGRDRFCSARAPR